MDNSQEFWNFELPDELMELNTPPPKSPQDFWNVDLPDELLELNTPIPNSPQEYWCIDLQDKVLELNVPTSKDPNEFWNIKITQEAMDTSTSNDPKEFWNIELPDELLELNTPHPSPGEFMEKFYSQFGFELYSITTTDIGNTFCTSESSEPEVIASQSTKHSVSNQKKHEDKVMHLVREEADNSLSVASKMPCNIEPEPRVAEASIPTQNGVLNSLDHHHEARIMYVDVDVHEKPEKSTIATPEILIPTTTTTGHGLKQNVTRSFQPIYTRFDEFRQIGDTGLFHVSSSTQLITNCNASQLPTHPRKLTKIESLKDSDLTPSTLNKISRPKDYRTVKTKPCMETFGKSNNNGECTQLFEEILKPETKCIYHSNAKFLKKNKTRTDKFMKSISKLVNENRTMALALEKEREKSRELERRLLQCNKNYT